MAQPRPDRRFYAANRAFGRFGMRWFVPQLMANEHAHGHIECNWLSAGEMTYRIDGRPVTIPRGRLVLFWAGIPHQTLAIAGGPSRQCNLYLPLDSFLHMPNLGTLTETMLGGGVVAFDPAAIGEETLRRWYEDYRSGSAERTDLLRAELALALRRGCLMGWTDLLPAWIDSRTPATRVAGPLRYVSAMIRHIIEHLGEPLRTADIAAVVGLHPNYALNLFTSVMNVSLHKFVVRMRLIRARSLLFEGNLSIENVAFSSGFSALSQFYEQFRNAYGITPREMRANYLHQPH
jgi:AraC family transcriptional regulator, melibiose operon regulatory protein